MKYVWSGPTAAETIYPAETAFDAGGKTDAKPLFEGTLTVGAVVDLPAEHPQVGAWIARGWLTEAKAAEKAAAKTGAGISDQKGAA